MTLPNGIVYLVGAGPGDPGLITVKGLTVLRWADVVLYDRLIPRDLLTEAPPFAEKIDVGKSPGGAARSQEEINRLLVEKAREGNVVVRLKGGDPFIFGRGSEELATCQRAGIDCVVIPGVTSAIAAPAAAGIPVTARRLGRSFAVITGHTEHEAEAAVRGRAAHPGGESDHRRAATAGGETQTTDPSREPQLPDHDYAALAKIDTLVVMMGRENLGRIAAALIEAGRDPQTPAACIASGTTAAQRTVAATLATIAEAAEQAGLQAPVVTVIGETAGMAPMGDTPASEANEHGRFNWPTQPAGPSPQADAASKQIASTIDARDRFRNADGRPLNDRRVAITQARTTSSELRRLLLEAGAEVLHCPLIEITWPQLAPQCDEAIGALARFDWTVFTSVHGVRGFWKRMDALGRDARAFGACKVAAVGPGTARELAGLGIRADLVPGESTAACLVQALRGLPMPELEQPMRVFFPHGDLALPTVAEGLRAAGAEVHEAIVYVTRDATPPRSAIRELEAGVHAILFCSPSAVGQFAKLELSLPGTVVGCIGPTTAAAACAAGLAVNVVPKRPGSAGLVAALADHIQAVGAER